MSFNKIALIFVLLQGSHLINGMEDTRVFTEYFEFAGFDELELLISEVNSQEFASKDVDPKDLSYEEFLNLPMAIRVACIFISERRDYFIGLLTYIFQNQKFLENNNFELALKIIRLFLLNKENIDEIGKNVLRNIWQNLGERLQEVYLVERSKLVSSNRLKFKVKEILKCFDIYCYNANICNNAEAQELIEIISNKSKEYLQQILEYLFLHYDEFELSTVKIPKFIKFVSLDINDECNGVAKKFLDILNKNYPKFSSLVYGYSDIWKNFTLGIELAELIIELKSFAKDLQIISK